jgi:hypothetical protein
MHCQFVVISIVKGKYGSVNYNITLDLHKLFRTLLVSIDVEYQYEYIHAFNRIQLVIFVPHHT